LKIVVNTIPLLKPLTGIGKYTYEISSRLNEAYYYYGFFSKKLLYGDLSKIKKNYFLRKIIRKSLTIFAKLYPHNFDIYFEPNFIINPHIKAKNKIVTIHDFSFENINWHPRERVEFFKKNFWSNIYEADHIITVSNFIKKEIMTKLNFDSHKISVIYNGVDHTVFKPINKDNYKLILPEKFILFVGSLEPRKNLISLLKAYNKLDKNLKKEYKLLLVGDKGWENKEIKNYIELNKDYMHYLGYVGDELLAEIYNRASLFVYPSLYEGFGMPPLEAMSCGAPVLVSNIEVMKEIYKDNVFYCGIEWESILEKIKFLLKNPDLLATTSLKGKNFSLNFSWEKTFKEHYKVFKKVYYEDE